MKCTNDIILDELEHRKDELSQTIRELKDKRWELMVKIETLEPQLSYLRNTILVIKKQMEKAVGPPPPGREPQ